MLPPAASLIEVNVSSLILICGHFFTVTYKTYQSTLIHYSLKEEPTQDV